MTQARKRLVCLEATPYYHVIGRCVRRAFLCGQDPLSGKDYEHRRQWMVERIGLLTQLFAIDVLAYAIMHNHYHLVIKLRPDRAERWTDEEILERWRNLYGLPPLLQRLVSGECDEAESQHASELVIQRRRRLTSLSWFMKCLNEFIARQSNREDDCTGAFWEGRFKSQALLDERALLACMAYVDLNPVRAGMAPTPETSKYTSVQARIRRSLTDPIPLALFQDQVRPEHQEHAIPFTLGDYLTLVDWSGRVERSVQKASISGDVPPILQRLAIDSTSWGHAIELFDEPFSVIGVPDRVRAAAKQFSRKWFRGLGEMRVLAKA